MASNEDVSNRLVDTAVFGRQVEEFTSSTIGRYLIQCADAEEEKGYKELKEVDPTDARGVLRAQNQVIRGEQFKSWLLEAVQAGLQAEGILENREDHEVPIEDQ